MEKQTPSTKSSPTPKDVPENVMDRIDRALVGQDLWLVGKDNLTPRDLEERRRFLNLDK
jgi:hypothetical protein